MNNSEIKLGIIGLSDGNGHPYSWSAIINGYNQEYMQECEFKAIPNYLKFQSWPQDFIKGARVTHIWTQEQDISEKIMRASQIQNLSLNPEDMIGKIDALLLARDDAENHYHHASPFLRSGIPIYIDKPLALSVDMAKLLLDNQLYPGQIFTCSALRYAQEFCPTEKELYSLGRIKRIEAVTPKSWDKYAVHIIEPVLNLLPTDSKLNKINRYIYQDSTKLLLSSSCGIEITFTSLGEKESPIYIKIFGEDDILYLEFRHPFAAFKMALEKFLSGVRDKTGKTNELELLRIIRVIEMGRR